MATDSSVNDDPHSGYLSFHCDFFADHRGFHSRMICLHFEALLPLFSFRTGLMSKRSGNQRPRFQNDVLLADVEQQAVELQLHKCQNKKLPNDFNIANGDYRSVY